MAMQTGSPGAGGGDAAGLAGAAPQRVAVAVVHGSLECAGRHVLVGHFKGTPLAGAEGFVDERLGGRLTARQLLGRYPEAVGDAIVVDCPHPKAPGRAGYPPGAIVVGLDLPGELTRDKLAHAVSAGLVCFAIRAMEARPVGAAPAGGPQLVEVAAVPIGTAGVGALSVESCVAAMVDGVALANEALFSPREAAAGGWAWDDVRIAGLTVVEVLSDKAERVAHALRRSRDLAHVDPGGHTRLELADRLVPGEGALPAAPSSPEQAGDWQRIVIRNPGREQEAASQAAPGAGTATVLEFTAIGRRARADAMHVPIDRRAVDRLVEGAVRDARPNRQVGNTLYELLLPNDLKADLARTENLQLIVDENTADLPWEALTARFGGSRARELAVRGGLLRQFRDTELLRVGTRAALGQRALVIGNPPPPPGFSALPGAGREATAVARSLAAKFDVSALVWDDDGDLARDDFADIPGTTGRRVLDALFSQDWRILHVAAHGRFDPADSSASGVVIDAETAITANVVRQLGAVPELVFLNCCHLAQVDQRSPGSTARNRLAASVARELMRAGVHAVVAAGWAVDDEAAVVFAETLYDRLLEGAFFGAAVQASRETVRHGFPGSTTWAAYQCYGDPGYRLFGAGATAVAHPHLVSADELVRRVKTITVLAGKIGLPDFEELTARGRDMIDELDRRRDEAARHRWATPVVLYHLGAAYAELGAYDRAVACYRQAWEHHDASTAPVRLVEQLGNLEVRLAQQRSRAATAASGPSEAGVHELVEAAERHLGLALALGETPERLALLASFHKKVATLVEDDRHRRHVAEAARCYREAGELREKLGLRPKPYHVLNWLQMAALAGTPLPPQEASAALASVAPGPREATAGERGDDGEDFWERVTRADLSLTRLLLGQPVDLGQLRDEYVWAFATRSSRRDRDSVVNHLHDVADLRPGTGLAELADALETPELPAGR